MKKVTDQRAEDFRTGIRYALEKFDEIRDKIYKEYPKDDKANTLESVARRKQYLEEKIRD